MDQKLHFFLLAAECGGNLTKQSSGVVTSPNYPEKYADSSKGSSRQCHWFIHVRPRHQILLNFEKFEVEGKPAGESHGDDGIDRGDDDGMR